ncbi:MAG: hypothetical protein NXI13_14395 [Proteobacteria bacterium]|nr:hypothetical protein [Pseudomonadota bacterium]
MRRVELAAGDPASGTLLGVDETREKLRKFLSEGRSLPYLPSNPGQGRGIDRDVAIMTIKFERAGHVGPGVDDCALPHRMRAGNGLARH